MYSNNGKLKEISQSLLVTVFFGCVCIYVFWYVGAVAVWPSGQSTLTVDLEFTGSSPASYHGKRNLYLELHPGTR